MNIGLSSKHNVQERESFLNFPSSSSSSDTALGQNMTIMAGFGVAHKLYIYKKKKKKN